MLETKGLSEHVRHANRLLKELRPAQVSLNFVSPAPNASPDIDISADYGVVKIEPFDASRLQYWARKGGSSWPFDIGALRGRPAIRSQERGVSLINTERLPGLDRLMSKWQGSSNQLVDAYYQAAVDVTADKVGSTIRRRLSLAEAAGIAGIDKSLVIERLLGVHLVTWSSSGVGSSGSWAVLRLPGVTLNWPEGRAWRRAQQWLHDEFGLDDLSGFDEQPLGAVAQTFAGLIQDARAHQTAGRVRESFLYFVIALDHLLGEDGRNLSTVADRTSVLTHRIRSKTFEEEVLCIKRVYDIRSRFVHSGVPVPPEHLLEADDITRCVLWAITHVVADQSAESRDTWVAKIDALAHLLRGDPSLALEDRFAAVGARASFRAGAEPPLLRYPRA